MTQIEIEKQAQAIARHLEPEIRRIATAAIEDALATALAHVGSEMGRFGEMRKRGGV